MDFCEIVETLRKRLRPVRKIKAAEAVSVISWNWVAWHLCKLLAKYPSGITKAIALTELQKKLDDSATQLRNNGGLKYATLAQIREHKKVPAEAVIECTIDKITSIPNTNTQLFCLSDTSGVGLEMYVHEKLSRFVSASSPLVSTNRKLRFTRCNFVESGQQRLLPTSYFVVLIPDDHEDGLLDDGLYDCSWNNASALRTSRVLIKVSDIRPEMPANSAGHLRRCDVLVQNAFSSAMSTMVLWDEQIALASLFKKGDLLIMDRPSASCSDHGIVFEYGPDTCIFCFPRALRKILFSSQKDGAEPASQLYLSQDDQGYVDFADYPESITVPDVRDCKAINVMLFGRVLEVSAQSTKSGLDSVGIHLLVETPNRVDVASISLRSSPLRVPRCRRGQAVLIQGLTSYQAQSRTVNQKMAFLYGIDWELQNISTTDGLLSSLSLASIKPSFDAIAMVQKLTPRTLLAGLAVVTSITEVDQDLTVEIHEDCGTILPSGATICPSCGSSLPKTSKSFLAVLRLDDGKRTLDCLCLGKCLQSILRINPEDWAGLSIRSQSALINSVAGKEFIFSLSYLGENAHKWLAEETRLSVPKTVLFRIEAIVRCNPSHLVEDFLANFDIPERPVPVKLTSATSL